MNIKDIQYSLTNKICKHCGSDEVVKYKNGKSRCKEETCINKDNVVKTLDHFVYANGRNIKEKCIDCKENERIYGSDTEYWIGEYADHENGLCDLHNQIHVDVAHQNESYCDFCESEVK